MSDIVERLREIPVWMVGAMTPGWQDHGTTAYEAAETILALRKEVEAIRTSSQRALTILERNLHRQTEKCDDAVTILRATLATEAE